MLESLANLVKVANVRENRESPQAEQLAGFGSLTLISK